ncbi:MAG: hypothetical protein RL023_151 [Candidatus Parcubacteria bacterium]
MFQEAICKDLIHKTKLGAEKYGAKMIGIC